MNRSQLPRFFRTFSRLFLVFVGFALFSGVAQAQVPAEPTKPADTTTNPTGVAAEPAQSQPQAVNPPDPTKSADALRLRIERARALIAAHRLDTAASELESVRATAQDNAFRNISSIMLMNVYLEEGNYARAEALLEENFKARSTQK
ncbi:MAG TPA: tetratricopeptide repeat protein, partial [Pyrinomonadaceae bacterium]